MLIVDIRDKFWHYPRALLFGKGSVLDRWTNFYRTGVPITTAVVLILIIGAIFFGAINNSKALLINSNKMLIEGVVVGTDSETFQLNQISKISPLTSDSNKSRLEKDLIGLIYESLIHVDQNGDPQPVLAGYLEVEKGRKYQFKLKDNLYWHDGKPITADDVVATFTLLQELEKNPQTSTLYSKAAVKMDIRKIENDSKSFEFIAKGNNVIPGFFEAISFKILPAHLLKDVTVDNINLPDPYINRNPVGSGPYKFFATSADSLDLIRNENYYGNKSSIDKIRFKFFANEQAALDAIKTGQIHTLVGISSNIEEQLSAYSNLAIAKSNVLYNQYWAIYFNLGENSDSLLKDVKIRQAISYAINKPALLENALNGYGQIAQGPIPPISFGYTSQYIHAFNLDTAKSLLDSAGWKVDPNSSFRLKDGRALTFKLVVIDSDDRAALAEQIRQQLKNIGMDVEIERQNTIDIKGTIVSRTFDAILYGTQTFIDPDRYELFHSSQIKDPGLNISSWASIETINRPVEGKKGLAPVPVSDVDLGTARGIINEDDRKKLYKEFQKVMANDVPVVFLYYPVEKYIYNKRLDNVVLQDLNSIEQRFTNIDQWKLD